MNPFQNHFRSSHLITSVVVTDSYAVICTLVIVSNKCATVIKDICLVARCFTNILIKITTNSNTARADYTCILRSFSQSWWSNTFSWFTSFFGILVGVVPGGSTGICIGKYRPSIWPRFNCSSVGANGSEETPGL